MKFNKLIECEDVFVFKDKEIPIRLQQEEFNVNDLDQITLLL